MANIQFKPTPEQAKLLQKTLERCNAACNGISQRGFEAGKVRQYDLHKLVYIDVRNTFEKPKARSPASVAAIQTAPTS